MTRLLTLASVLSVLMAGAAAAADRPEQNEGAFHALPGISASPMTDAELAAVEGQSAIVYNYEGPYHGVATPSGRTNDHIAGDHVNGGPQGASTIKYTQGVGGNYVYTPSGNQAGWFRH